MFRPWFSHHQVTTEHTRYDKCTFNGIPFRYLRDNRLWCDKYYLFISLKNCCVIDGPYYIIYCYTTGWPLSNPAFFQHVKVVLRASSESDSLRASSESDSLRASSESDSLRASDPDGGRLSFRKPYWKSERFWDPEFYFEVILNNHWTNSKLYYVEFSIVEYRYRYQFTQIMPSCLINRCHKRLAKCRIYAC
jgi:hypothetical protein